VFQLWWSVPPGDGPLPPARRAGVRTLHEEVRVLVEGTHEAPLGRAGLLCPCCDEHQAQVEIGVSSNGRAAVLQTADGGSIPSTPTDATSFVCPKFSPIEGREPAFEAGDAGSIPARGAHVVVVVYWSARLAVNEEVRVRSPPVTPQAATGCGSMAGHLARNQVHAGSIPAAQIRECCRMVGNRSRKPGWW
jgi:hypothetical protein